MIFTDLPYGTTKNGFDKPLDLPSLWNQYERIIKDNGAIVLFAQTPYDKTLGNSNLKLLRYEWIWEKPSATGFFNAKKMPMKAHENILVFYKRLPIYNPQKTIGHKPVHSYTKRTSDGSNYGESQVGISGGGSTERYPRSVLKFSTDKQKSSLHPQQKPLALCEYIIKTYTNECDIVLDSCMGSGTIGEACKNINRDYIGIEKEKCFFEIAQKRIMTREQKDTTSSSVMSLT